MISNPDKRASILTKCIEYVLSSRIESVFLTNLLNSWHKKGYLFKRQPFELKIITLYNYLAIDTLLKSLLPSTKFITTK